MAPRRKKLAGLAAFGALLLVPLRSNAEPPATCGSVTRESVVGCVLRASATLRADREATTAAVGKRTAAAPWFPSSPTLAASLSRRAGIENHSDALNYGASLSQEIEVAGERAARRRAADADVEARTYDVQATSRRIAAEAYAAFFDVIASREGVDVALRLEATAEQIARVTRGRADAGVASPMDAELAEAASLRVKQGRIGAERDLRVATVRLASLLGRDTTTEPLVVTGVLEPLGGADASVRAPSTTQDRPEVRALVSDRRAWEARAEAFRRARVPSVTVQLFAQNDGYNERVLGAGVSVPITLPQPVGHSNAGEIDEADALARQAAARAEAVARDLAADLAVAKASYESRRAEAALFAVERAERSSRMLADLGKEIEAGRLSVRDALVAEQQLIDVLRGAVETRRALCLASVDLVLAAGLPFEGAGR